MDLQWVRGHCDAEVHCETRAPPEVLKITPNATLTAPVEPAASCPESNIALVRAPELWGLGYRGDGVVVASMDSGVDASHPDLAAQWRGGTNSWFDPNGQHPTSPIDMSGHGTKTMGVMVGRGAGGTDVGVAPNARWIAVKIFNDAGSATVAGIHAGFQWLLDPDGDPATADSPHVVNNSWTFSSTGCNLEFQLDLQTLRAADIIPVFAAGNYGPLGSSSRSPADNPEALAVGATTKTDGIYTYSSRGPTGCADTDPTYPEVVAPGASIRTTDRFGGYATVSGTSLAAPHVTGALALLRQGHSGATATQLESALESSAVDLGALGPDNNFGYGRLDVLAAHERFGVAGPDFALAASPSSASTAPGGNVSYAVSVTPLSGFTSDVALSVAGVPPDASASFVPDIIAGGAGTSELTVTTSSTTPAGSYPLTITGTEGSVSRSASVTLLVDPPPDFTLAASPAEASTAQGGDVSYTVSVGSVFGFSADVALSVDGLPEGATSGLSPATITGGVGSSQLTVATTDSTPPGTSTLTITGTSGATVHTSSVALTVESGQVVAAPTSTTLMSGTLRSGTAASLAADDALSYEVNSTLSSIRATAWRGNFPGVSNSLTALSMSYKGKNSRACAQTVSMWRWPTSSWVDLDSRTVGTAEVLIADLVQVGVPSDYVSGTSGEGELRIRVRCTTRSGIFFTSGNLLRIVYS